MIAKSYGLVGDADGHSQRVHQPYLSLTTSRFVVLLPTTVLLEFTYEFDIQEKACFSRSRGEVQSSGPFANGPPPLASTVINRIAPQGSHRYSRRGHNTIELDSAPHVNGGIWCFPSVLVVLQSFQVSGSEWLGVSKGSGRDLLGGGGSGIYVCVWQRKKGRGSKRKGMQCMCKRVCMQLDEKWSVDWMTVIVARVGRKGTILQKTREKEKTR